MDLYTIREGMSNWLKSNSIPSQLEELVIKTITLGDHLIPRLYTLSGNGSTVLLEEGGETCWGCDTLTIPTLLAGASTLGLSGKNLLLPQKFYGTGINSTRDLSHELSPRASETINKTRSKILSQFLGMRDMEKDETKIEVPVHDVNCTDYVLNGFQLLKKNHGVKEIYFQQDLLENPDLYREFVR